MCLGYFNWLDKLLYNVNLKIGNEDDIDFMERYKKSMEEYNKILKDKNEL